YIVGGWNGWKTFREMKRIDSTHFTTTILSNKLFKYNYFAGQGWGYMELGANKIVRADRSYSTDDVVLDWAAVYDKAVPDADITYSVTVPEGTNSCYIAGSWNRWLFLEMEKVDSRHFAITLKSNKALKYLYLSGPDWNCIEVSPGKNEVAVRTYSDNDLVLGWKSVWKKMNRCFRLAELLILNKIIYKGTSKFEVCFNLVLVSLCLCVYIKLFTLKSYNCNFWPDTDMHG
ncbi:MAG TPA: hypothetical protein VI413_07815, partial [Paludibacter sp.]